ncbi:MAG: methyltransferase domain-containing protein [Elusimicrobia bacterium]|nr:methyltransferase domain-containing protein [Elusimicrobiota bacterium]
MRKIKRRLLGRARDLYDLEDVIESPKYMRPQRVFDFMNRYQILLKKRAGWKEFVFEGADVLELGSGPMLGWGPLAIFLGSRRYTCIEPFYNHAIIESDAVRKNFFLPLFKDLSAIFGERYESFDEFMRAVVEKSEIFRCEFEAAPCAGPYQISLSNSTLEHVSDLEGSLKKLKAISAPAGRFLHLVDFGNHRSTINPFDGIYSATPDEYFKRHGRHINLHRAPDMLRLFRQAGFFAEAVPYYHYREFYSGVINPYWSQRYSQDELFLKTAIICDAC